MSESKTVAKFMCQSYREMRLASPHWRHIDAPRLINELEQRVDEPHLISQVGLPSCGPTAFIYNLAKYKPVTYVRYAIRLFLHASSHLGQYHVAPSAKVRAVDPSAGVDESHADWVTIAGLRDSANLLFTISSKDDWFAPLSVPCELTSWFRNGCLYREVINCTNLFFTKGIVDIRNAADLWRDGWIVCIFMNTQMFNSDQMTTWSWAPNHWITLNSDVDFSGGNIRFDAFTWTVERFEVPDEDETLSTTDFLKNFYGYVAANPAS